MKMNMNMKTQTVILVFILLIGLTTCGLPSPLSQTSAGQPPVGAEQLAEASTPYADQSRFSEDAQPQGQPRQGPEGEARSSAVQPVAPAAPVTGHPRLWLRATDLPRLRSWAAASNSLYQNGLAVLAAQAKADMDAGHLPGDDTGGADWEQCTGDDQPRHSPSSR